ncbi:interferon alpha/beta receptor 2-like isoform X1 [Scyliorhinus torazame]|uniref:interferon alpha/beta receptor 2-like isoform X1 n=1 Tax=Scyliorhinus torazame TaxID=75743 RepID=UPI003B5BC2DD
MFTIVSLLYNLQFLNSVIAVVPPPVKLSFPSENLHHVLMWEAGTGTPFTTRYTVQYLALSTLGMEEHPQNVNQTNDEERAWVVVQNCSLISNRTCDLTNEFTDIYESYFTRVKAVTEMDESNWTSSNVFQPLDDSKLRPVNFNLSESTIGELKVNFDIPSIPPFIPDFGSKSFLDILFALYYSITVSKGGELEKIRDVLERTEKISVEEIFANVQPNTNYCVTIRLFTFDKDQSDPLETKCIVTQYESKVKVPQTLLIVFLCGLGVGLVMVIVVLYKGGYLGFLSKYGPQALNNLKHIHPVYNCNNVQEKLSSLEPVHFKEKKIENLEEDSEEELMNCFEEAGYEQNSLTVPVQNSAQSSSTFSKVGTDEASTMSCDDRLCDSVPGHLLTNLDDCRVAPIDVIQNDFPGAETASQTETIHSRKSSSASANNVSDVPLWSIQIHDEDCCFVDFSNENMFDQEAHEPDSVESDDLSNSLLSKVCDNPSIYQYEKPSRCDIPGTSLLPQALHSDYMRR